MFRYKARVLIKVKINTQAINCNKSQLQFTTQLFCELKSLKHKHIIHLEKNRSHERGKLRERMSNRSLFRASYISASFF